MTPGLSEVITAIVAALQQAHATFDLSGTDAVKFGDFVTPPVLPFASVGVPEGESTPEAAENWHRHTAQVEVRLFATYTVGDANDRARRALTMLDECMAAIATARRTSGNTLRRLARLEFPEYAVIAPATDADVARATFTVSFEFRRSAGVG